MVLEVRAMVTVREDRGGENWGGRSLRTHTLPAVFHALTRAVMTSACLELIN